MAKTETNTESEYVIVAPDEFWPEPVTPYTGPNPLAAPELLAVCESVAGEIDLRNAPAHFRKGGAGSGGKLAVFLSSEQVAALVAVIAKARKDGA